MKAMKVFVKTCFSETLLAGTDVENEKTAVEGTQRDGEIDGSNEKSGTGASSEDRPFHGGLGLTYKFPGDPKKYAYVSIKFVC